MRGLECDFAKLWRWDELHRRRGVRYGLATRRNPHLVLPTHGCASRHSQWKSNFFRLGESILYYSTLFHGSRWRICQLRVATSRITSSIIRSCSILRTWRNMMVWIDRRFCGDWAGTLYSPSGWPGKCADKVAWDPHSFKETYFGVKSLKVHKSFWNIEIPLLGSRYILTAYAQESRP